MYLRNERWMEENRDLQVTQFFDCQQLQKMQDAFCTSSHVYCVCLAKDASMITTFSGSEREIEYWESVCSVDFRRDLIAAFSDVEGENVVMLASDVPYLRVAGIAIRGNQGRLLGAWMLLGVVEERVPEDEPLSMRLQVVKEDGVDAAVALLEVLSTNYFANKNKLANLKEDISALEEEEKRMEYLLEKTEVLTEILKMMESDDTFTTVIDGILQQAGEYIKLNNASLIKIDTESETAELVCQWKSEEKYDFAQLFETVSKEQLPFATGRPYTISSETVMPEVFTNFFAEFGITCGVFLPINIAEENAMYLCFTMLAEGRKWDVEDLKFFNDVKRVIQTILVKRITKNSLASSYSVLEAILENAGCGVCVLDIKRQNALYMNENYKTLDLKPEDQAELDKLLLIPEAEDKSIHEYHAVGSERWFEITFSYLRWVDGRQVRLATVYDISTTKKYQGKVEKQANEDYLTGLYNRMRFEKDLEREIHDAVCAGGQSAVLYIDLDDFDNINDGLGHQAGDHLLKNVARSLKRINGIEDTCYRVGGDEFIVIVPSRKMEKLQSIINSIVSVFSKPWVLDGTEYYCTMSMGVVMIPKDGVDVNLLMKRADVALHAAKGHGKNRVEYYNDDQNTSVVERLDMEKSMREAVEHGCKEFEVYYQPLIDVTKPEQPCCGAEALVRWNSPTMGMVMPSQFIQLAEYLGLITDIGRHVLIEACKRCKYWNDFGHPEYKVNVNLSVVQLLQNDIIDTIKEAIEITEVNPRNLTLEVTEGLAINDMNRMQFILAEIKALGVRVALDDFGTGYSSLSHLRNMPIDVIKIDRCFVEDIGENVFSDAFVKTVSQLADTLDMNICVEGVEEQRQCDALGKMNVGMIQGFLFDRPLSSEEFENKYLI